MWRGDSRDRGDRVHTLTEGWRGCVWIGATITRLKSGERRVCVCLRASMHTCVCESELLLASYHILHMGCIVYVYMYLCMNIYYILQVVSSRNTS